ncbi:Retrovirus-related Pol polyprotein from transposon TNT 1-94 [Gossypium australe]|uniref:Retrovirus-related Pol polyprotein from transposon TNT 1-94 n=1 Tax=Gossypium australe TaxID=47621 RepID=A0A5B6W659_9ROSI|nr:Retrovirus-related Pol polyprotein from transposon TNT 1-94 [Gossypium australe]
MVKLGMEFGKTVKLKSDNRMTINIAKGPVHCKKIENFKVQCPDILTKALQGPNLERLFSKLGMR